MFDYKLIIFNLAICATVLFDLVQSQKAIQLVNKNDDSAEIEQIATIVCRETKTSEYQIRRVDTFERLFEFFQKLPVGHALTDCKEEYMSSIEKILSVINTGNQDVCSDETISQIENFHIIYVSLIARHNREKRNKAPPLVKAFFMRYANLVSSTCASSAMTKLSKVLNPSVATVEHQVENVFKEYLDLLGPISVFESYDTLLLPWNLMVDLQLPESSSLAKYLHSGRKHLYISLRKAGKFAEMQYLCSRVLKPLYSQTLLPIMRLVDLGYYPEDPTEQLASKLRDDKSMRSLYTMTQMCETILPLGIVEDYNLETGQIVILTKEETEKKDFFETQKDDEPKEQLILDQTDNSFSELDQLPSMNMLDASNKLSLIEANIKARSLGINQILKLLIKTCMSKSETLNEVYFGSVKNPENLKYSLKNMPVDEDNPLHLDKHFEEQTLVSRRKRSLSFFKSSSKGNVNMDNRLNSLIFVITEIILLLFRTVLQTFKDVIPNKIIRYLTNSKHLSSKEFFDREMKPFFDLYSRNHGSHYL